MFTFAFTLAFIGFLLLAVVPRFVTDARGEVRFEAVFAILGWVAVCVAIAFFMTGVSMHQFATDCANHGGAYVLDGGTAWCRY